MNMNFDAENASVVAYESASRLYKILQTNKWGKLTQSRVNLGMEKCQFFAGHIMKFLLADDNSSSYTTRVAALKSSLTILEGVVLRSKEMVMDDSTSINAKEFLVSCKENMQITTFLENTQSVVKHIQELQQQAFTATTHNKVKL